MTRAKVKVDPTLRVVEIATGNPEEMMVSQPLLPPAHRHPLGPPSSEGEGIWVAWCWNLRVNMVSEPRGWLCGRPRTMPASAPGPRGGLCGLLLSGSHCSLGIHPEVKAPCCDPPKERVWKDP